MIPNIGRVFLLLPLILGSTTSVKDGLLSFSIVLLGSRAYNNDEGIHEIGRVEPYGPPVFTKKRFGAYECMGTENNRGGGPGNREYTVLCNGIKCVYVGNPHKLPAYNKNGGQIKFYGALLDVIGDYIGKNHKCLEKTIDSVKGFEDMQDKNKQQAQFVYQPPDSPDQTPSKAEGGQKKTKGKKPKK